MKSFTLKDSHKFPYNSYVMSAKNAEEKNSNQNLFMQINARNRVQKYATELCSHKPFRIKIFKKIL